MNWTVGRRIVIGYAVVLALLVLVTALGIRSLQRAARSYESALEQRRTGLVPALRAESEVRVSNVAFLRSLVAPDPRHTIDRDSTTRLARELLAQLRDSSATPELRRTWTDALDMLDQWSAAITASDSANRAGDRALALSIRAERSQPLRARLDGLIREGVARTIAHADETADSGATTAVAAQTALWAGGLAALIAGLLSAFLLHRAVARPLQETSAVIASGSTQILAATTEQAAGANETLAAVSETVATVDEVAQTAEQATERARAVADSAQRAAEIGRAGRRAVDDSVSGMDSVRAQVESIGESILALAEQAQAIGEIITSVTDIADQTNLLALNAAVEAARAGDAGRGFAVVAGEVRGLAEQSKRATGQVRQILGEIQRATNNAVMATEQGTKQVATANRQVQDAGDTIRSLVDAVQDAAQTSAQIVASAGQQAIGMEQIRQAVGNIHSATQQNLTASRQSEQAAQHLARLGERLIALVGGRPGTSRAA